MINYEAKFGKDDIQAVGKSVIVTDLERGYRRRASGLIEVSDIADRTASKPPRWCRVLSVGAKAEVADQIQAGDWILVEFNRWTPRVELSDSTWINMVEDTAVLLKSDQRPEGMYSKQNTV